jgi:hypothetical protein
LFTTGTGALGPPRIRQFDRHCVVRRTREELRIESSLRLETNVIERPASAAEAASDAFICSANDRT